jgi:hypothetical protein
MLHIFIGGIWGSVDRMNKKKLLEGGLIGFLGWLLSPLSWWNDVFINIPIAWLLASLVKIFFPRGFLSAFLLSYWATNFFGIGLMYYAAKHAQSKKISRKEIMISFFCSILYMVGIVILIKLKILKPIPLWENQWGYEY